MISVSIYERGDRVRVQVVQLGVGERHFEDVLGFSYELPGPATARERLAEAVAQLQQYLREHGDARVQEYVHRSYGV